MPPEADTDFVWEDWRPGYLVWDALSSPDGSLAVLGISELDLESGQPGPSHLWVSNRLGDGWSEPRQIESISAPEGENFPVFTPDGSDLLFVRGFATYFRVPVSAIR